MALCPCSDVTSRSAFCSFFDGFRTSSEMQQIEVLEIDELQSFVDKESLRRFRDRALRPDQPKVRAARKTLSFSGAGS